MPAYKFKPSKVSATQQITHAMNLLELHGATKKEIWYAIDEVVNAKNTEIEQLKNGLQAALDRWNKGS